MTKFNGNKLTVNWLEDLTKEHLNRTGKYSFVIDNIKGYIIMRQSRTNPSNPLVPVCTFYIDGERVSRKAMKEYLA